MRIMANVALSFILLAVSVPNVAHAVTTQQCNVSYSHCRQMNAHAPRQQKTIQMPDGRTRTIYVPVPGSLLACEERLAACIASATYAQPKPSPLITRRPLPPAALLQTGPGFYRQGYRAKLARWHGGAYGIGGARTPNVRCPPGAYC